jgi:hypothetical protein
MPKIKDLQNIDFSNYRRVLPDKPLNSPDPVLENILVRFERLESAFRTMKRPTKEECAE